MLQVASCTFINTFAPFILPDQKIARLGIGTIVDIGKRSMLLFGLEAFCCMLPISDDFLLLPFVNRSTELPEELKDIQDDSDLASVVAPQDSNRLGAFISW